MLYALSKLIPVRMTSTYGVGYGDHDTTPTTERATWWQWRGHVYRHRRFAA
jgi:hypothetical protein